VVQKDGKPIDAPKPDAAKLPDAMPADAGIDAPQHVFAVTCPSTPAKTVTTGNMVYVPASTTINVGDIVQFRTAPTHDVAPDATNSDPGLVVGFDQTACLQFMTQGTYGFHCSIHFFSGTITVQ
jgi:plastocyanin